MDASNTRPGEETPQPVLLFDAECGLCLRCVRWLVKRDKGARLHFVPLQSGAGQAYLGGRGLPTDDFDTALFVADWQRREEGKPLRRTDALVAAAREVRGARWLGWLRVVPRPVRDAVYRIVARLRLALAPRDDRAERLDKLRQSGRIWE